MATTNNIKENLSRLLKHSTAQGVDDEVLFEKICKEIKEQVANEDYTVIHELLRNVPREQLLAFLPEEISSTFKDTKADEYFSNGGGVNNGESGITYEIKYWETEEDRDNGESSLTGDEYKDLAVAISAGEDLWLNNEIACVEVQEVGSQETKAHWSKEETTVYSDSPQNSSPSIDTKQDELSTFILLENEKYGDVRYIAVGVISSNGLLTGIVHGYEGGGEYSEQFIVNGEYVSNYNNDEEVSLEWEEQIEMFEELTYKGFSNLLDAKIAEHVHYNKETMHNELYQDVDYTFDGAIMRDNFNTIPPSYCNTSWKIDKETVEAFSAPICLLKKV